MNNQQRRLGRGLEALLSKTPGHESSDAADEHRSAPRAAQAGEPAAGLLHLPVGQIDPNPFQPRQEFNDADLAELAASLGEHGLLQPLVVRRHGARYQLVAGERRLRAAQRAGWSEVPVQVRDADDRQMTELAIVENLQRRDLNPLEKAHSFEGYLERYDCTQEDLANRLKVDRSTISNLIRLLELPDAVQSALRRGSISQGHARALLPLGDERQQVELCHKIESESLSVRSTESLVQDMIQAEELDETESLPLAAGQSPPARSVKKRPKRAGQIAQLEQDFRSALGTKVSIRVTAQGRGKIVVEFANHEEFERLRDLMCGPEVQSRAG